MTICDFHNILLVCKTLKTYTENHTEIFERECLRLFTSDLSLFELENPRTDSLLTNAPQIPRWEKIMRKGGLLTQEWKSIGPVEGLKDATFVPVLISLLASLRDPNLPTPELFRDEFNAYKKSILQEHLYEFIFKEGQSGSTASSSLVLGDMPPLGLPSKSEEPDLLQELGQMGWSFASQCKTFKEKEAFLNLRWYRLPKKTKCQIPLLESSFDNSFAFPHMTREPLDLLSDISLSDAEYTPIVVTLLKLVLMTITFFCRVSRAVIDRESNPSEFLREYCKRWSGYSAAMIELDVKMEPFCKLINDCYELLFPQYPQYPKFSLTRAMVILWKFKVFEKLAPRLFDSVEYCLQIERIESLKETPKSPEEGKEFCFPEASVVLLERFFHAVADLSINELKVHHLGSTKLELEGPYLELHKQFLRHTKKFFKECALAQTPQRFNTTVMSDIAKTKEIVLPVTHQEAKKLVRKYTEKCLRVYSKIKYIISKLKQFDPSQKDSEVLPLPESHLGRFLRESCETIEIAQEFYCSFHRSEGEVCRMYEQALSSREELENLSDLEIEYMNKKRNIPLELSEEERVLYTFSQAVTPDVLDSICEKFAGLYSESKEEEEKDQTEEEEKDQTEEDFGDFDELPMLGRS